MYINILSNIPLISTALIHFCITCGISSSSNSACFFKSLPNIKLPLTLEKLSESFSQFDGTLCEHFTWTANEHAKIIKKIVRK